MTRSPLRSEHGTAGSQRLPVLLFVVAIVLASVAIVGGVLTFTARADRAQAQEADERYGEVMRQAAAVATAFTNLDFEEPDASLEQVRDLTTGEFRDQYESSAGSLVELVTNFQARLESEVTRTAVSSLDGETATVLVATSGTVVNQATGEEGQARNFRLLLSMVEVDGEWLADDVEFVG